MRIKYLATTIGFLVMVTMLIAVNARAQTSNDCCATIYNNETIKQASLKQLSKEYRRLSRNPCAACYYWASSGLQQVMTELGTRLEGKSNAEIRKAMGKPDDKNNGQWIYDWRYGHDYLYFKFEDNRAKANWYYSYE